MINCDTCGGCPQVKLAVLVMDGGDVGGGRSDTYGVAQWDLMLHLYAQDTGRAAELAQLYVKAGRAPNRTMFPRYDDFHPPSPVSSIDYEASVSFSNLSAIGQVEV